MSQGHPEGAPSLASSRGFPCESCGADLVFAIGQQELSCPYCGFTRALPLDENAEIREQDLLSSLEEQSARRAAPPGEEASEIRCPSCHATVALHGNVTSSACAWCGSPIQRSDVHRAADRIPVDAVLPFQVDKKKARDGVRRWLRSLWFAPGDFSRKQVPERLQSVYLPYWTFDAATFTRYAGERGDARTRTVGSGENRRQVTEIRWRSASGAFQRLFDDLPVAAEAALPEAVLRRLEPWPSAAARPYQPELLAGHLAKTYDVPLADGWKLARERIDDELRRETRRRIGGTHQRIHQLWTRFDGLTYKHLLLPVWLLTLRHGDHRFRIVVNGATGEVQGERAWSWIKIAAATVTALALGAALYLAFNGGAR